jgi:hypothetical protein
MDSPGPVSPSALPPDPPSPYWRWETLASLGLIGAIILFAVLAVNVNLLRMMRAETLVTLLIAFFAFGIVLGFSGARQGGRANRIVAVVAMASHLLLMLALLTA